MVSVTLKMRIKYFHKLGLCNVAFISVPILFPPLQMFNIQI
jgi:hypothetical protein